MGAKDTKIGLFFMFSAAKDSKFIGISFF